MMPILAGGDMAFGLEARACLGNGPCDGGDHPNHHDGPVPLKFAERVESANGVGATDLSASTLEFVLKVQ